MQISLGEGTQPFKIELLSESADAGHGTLVRAFLEKRYLPAEDLKQLIGSKFIVDPSLRIRVNSEPVELLSVAGLKSEKIDIGRDRHITVHFIDSKLDTRTTRLRGITWWVNTRRVGEPSWNRLDDEGAYLGGKTEQAKRYSFIVEADFLKPGRDIKADWTSFHATRDVAEARDAAHSCVLREIQNQLASSRKQRKKSAIVKSKELLGELPGVARKNIGQFIDEVQEHCPLITSKDLALTVRILAKLEQSRSGYDLLVQLAACAPDDLDKWTELMQQWTASNAELVLNELDRRLKLIDRMQSLVGSPHADELHDLQPLFEQGLWIFGPEYESVEFRSNRGLAEVIGRFLGGKDYMPPVTRRPDFVALPETSLGTYSADAYDNSGEVCGIRKVAVLELKKGGSQLKRENLIQAWEYCEEIKKGGRLSADAEIVAYVLGQELTDGLDVLASGGSIKVIPMVYDTVLRKAHQRTFNLQSRLRNTQTHILDSDVEEALRDGGQLTFLDDDIDSEEDGLASESPAA